MGEAEYSWKYEKETHKVSGDFDDLYASVITSVAKASPAEKLGLMEGDFIVSFDGTPLLWQGEIDLTASTSTTKYQFYSHKDHSLMNIEIDPIPLGIITEPSSKYILKELKNDVFPGWEGFRLLWKRREWEKLLEASEVIYSDTTLNRLIRKIFKKYGGNGGMLYKGAALFEMNREEEGIKFISRFINNHLSSYETYEHAIAYFYAAKWAEIVGDNDGIEHWLAESDRSNAGEFERISQEVYLKGYEPFPERYKWKNKKFPSSYSLERLDKTGIATLSEALSELGNDQFLPVCVMPFYRGNGPYNDAMGCYGSMYSYISTKISPMHIILDTLEKVKGEEWRYENEESLSENSVPFELLHDPARLVSEDLELEYSPVFYFLNKEGIVVYEGPLRRAFDYWSVLGSIPNNGN